MGIPNAFRWCNRNCIPTRNAHSLPSPDSLLCSVIRPAEPQVQHHPKRPPNKTTPAPPPACSSRDAISASQRDTRFLGSDADRLLGLERGRDLVLLAVVEVEQLEPVRHGRAALLRRTVLLPRLGRRRRRVRLGAFVNVVVDLLALVSPTLLLAWKTKATDTRQLTAGSACTAGHRWRCAPSSAQCSSCRRRTRS